MPPREVTTYRYSNDNAHLVRRSPPSDDDAARFTLTYYLSGEIKYSYTFYVTPEQIQISVPSRMAVYQTIGGNTYVDHLGEGTSSIQLSGTTAYRLGAKYAIGFGYASYQMLRYLVNQYNDACRQGLTAKTRLVLHIGFPDSGDFGTWDVTIHELTLSRNAAQPLLFRYALNLICLTTDQAAADRPIIDLSKLKSRLIGTTITLPGTPQTEQQVPDEAQSTAEQTFGGDYIEYTVPAPEEASEDSPNTLAGIASKLLVNGVSRLTSSLSSYDYQGAASISAEIGQAVLAIMNANPEMFTQTGKYEVLQSGVAIRIPQTTASVATR